MSNDEYYAKINALLVNMEKNTKKIPMPGQNILKNELRKLKQKTLELMKND